MQPELRGVIEQYIEFALSDAQMGGYRQYIEALKPHAKSVNDAILGLVVGTIIASCLDQIIVYNHGSISPVQIEKLREIVTEKIPKIKSRVLETFI